MRTLTAYDLKSFYNGLKGRIIRGLVRKQILEIWPEVKAKNIMGYGYAVPYLRPYMKTASQVFVAMPSQLGVHHWPPEGGNLVTLSAEDTLPFETNSIDRIIMIHALEFLDTPEETFAELWRVLKSSGRLIIVVPNRMGLWARADWSPFGQGQPYSAGQVEELLRESLFVHEQTRRALFSPPFKNSLFLRGARIFEQIGLFLCPALGGVHIIEASKQLYAGTGVSVRSNTRRRVKKVVSVKPVPTPRVKS